MFFQRLTLVVTLTCIALVIASCSDSTGPATSGNEPMALVVGNQWISRTTQTGGNIRYDTLRITGSTNLSGELWYQVNNSGLYYCNRPAGLFTLDLLGGGTVNGAIARLLMRANPHVGDTVTDYGRFVATNDKGRILGRVHNYSVVTELNVGITVPAGRFSCVKVEHRMDWLEGAPDNPLPNPFEIDYVATGAGFVKQQYYSADSTGATVPEDVRELYEMRPK